MKERKREEGINEVAERNGGERRRETARIVKGIVREGRKRKIVKRVW